VGYDRTVRLRTLVQRVVDTYSEIGGINRIGEENLPSQAAIVDVLGHLLTIVFPGYYGGSISARADLNAFVAAHIDTLFVQLSQIVEQTLRFCYHTPCRCSRLWYLPDSGSPQDDFVNIAEVITTDYLERLPGIRAALSRDVQAAYEGDPAAVNRDEVILCYPGSFAIAVYRLAHPLYQLGVPLVPRIMTEWAHHRTGVDIHPGASIGSDFFIDHGTGVVIGETTNIGERVKLYQGVTLGALSFPRKPDGTLVKGGKRHPTLEDDVTVYANATILGGETVIGKGAVIGGGAWITSSVAAAAKVISATTENSNPD
jgi:serine O-acetyltransferase